MSASFGNFQICFKHTVSNGSITPLLYRARGGMNVIIPGNDSSGFNGNVYITVELSCYSGNQLLFDVNGITNQFDKELAEDFMADLNQYNETLSYTTHEQRHTITKVYEVKNRWVENDIFKSEILGIELLFRTPDVPDDVFNGKSITGSISRFKEQNREKEKHGTLKTTFRVVDNDNRFPTLWIRLLGKSQMIPKTTSLDDEEGLYVLFHDSSKRPVTDFVRLCDLTQDKFAEYGIYFDEFSAVEDKNSKLIQELQSKVKAGKAELNKAKDMLKDSDKKLVISLDENYMLKSEIRMSKNEMRMTESRHRQSVDKLKSKHESDRGSDIIKNVIGIGGFLLGCYKAFN